MNYIVKKGDSLAKIASQILGNVALWTEIAVRNGISPPYKIYVGQSLDLPPVKPKAGAKSVAGPVNPH